MLIDGLAKKDINVFHHDYHINKFIRVYLKKKNSNSGNVVFEPFDSLKR